VKCFLTPPKKMWLKKFICNPLQCKLLLKLFLVAQLDEALCYKLEGRGFIPNGIIGTFHSLNPSSRTRILVSTKSLTKISTRNLLLGVMAAGAYSWQFFQLHVPII
jgi:hypothetical protein